LIQKWNIINYFTDGLDTPLESGLLLKPNHHPLDTSPAPQRRADATPCLYDAIQLSWYTISENLPAGDGKGDVGIHAVKVDGRLRICNKKPPLKRGFTPKYDYSSLTIP
jgi:hypothetical protein